MKRKTYIVDGFKGQNSKDAAELLPVGEMQTMQGGFVNVDGSFDGDQVGTAEVKTGLSHEPIIIHEWKSNDGYEYVFTWGIESSLGVVNYYDKTTPGAVVTNFLTAMPPSYPPELVNWGNEYVVLLGGKFGNYKIASSGGVLTATSTTDVPGANFGRVNAGALYLAQETSIIHSVAGNPLRFTPTREERLAGVHDLANRLILSSAGVQGETIGYEIWKGYHILWTQYDMYVAAWDGAGTAYATKLSGYGLYGLKAWACLDDKLLFYSTYKQGSCCYIVTGTAGGNGETFTVGQNLQVSVIEAPASKKISDILKACPKPTSGKKVIAIDSKEDWDGSKISTDLSATGWDTDTTPGWVSLQGASKLTLTPVTRGNVISGGSYGLSDFMTLYDTNPDGEGVYLDVDTKPGPYPAVAAPLTAHVITADLVATARLNLIKSYFLRIEQPDGTEIYLSDKDTGSAYVASNTGWQSFILAEPTLAISVELFIVGQYALSSGAKKDIQIVRRYSFPSGGAYSIQKCYINNFTPSLSVGVEGSSSTYTIGEVEIWGFQQSTGLITTGPSATTSLSIAGLAAGITDLGLFQIGYQGTDNDGTGGLTGATAPTAVEVGIGTTTDPTHVTTGWGTEGNPTQYGSISYMTAAELKIGMKLSRLINATFPFAAGGTLYMRARVPVTVQASSFASPMIDRLMWDFTKGSARTSCFPIFTWQGKSILSLMTNSSSTECDQAIALNENGGATFFDNVKWMAGFADPDETFVTAGKTIGKLGEGTNNLIWGGATSTDTPIEKIITTPKIKGIHKMFARKVKFGISKFVSAGTLTNTTSMAAITTSEELINNIMTGADSAANAFGIYNADPGLSVLANDGNIYFLSAKPAGPPTVELIKMTPAGVLTRTILETYSSIQYSIIAGGSIVLDNDTLHIFWTGYVSGLSRIARYRQYTVSTATLGTISRFANDLTTATYNALSAVKAANNDIFVAVGVDAAATDIVEVYKSTNGGTTFTIDKTITCGAGAIAVNLQMWANYRGGVSLAWTQQSTGNMNCLIENDGRVWGDIKNFFTTNNYSFMGIRGVDDDYFFLNNNTACICYKRNGGTWTSLGTVITGTGFGPHFTIVLSSYGTFVMFMQNAAGSTWYIVEGNGTSWTTPKSAGVLGAYVKAARGCSDIVYLWGIATYWKPFKATLTELSGAYPLRIIAITENESSVVYEHNNLITTKTYIPERGIDLRLVQGKSIQFRLSAIGQLKCHGVGIEYDEQEGSL